MEGCHERDHSRTHGRCRKPSGQRAGRDIYLIRCKDEVGGIAQALGLAEQFVGQDRMVVILGDNIFSAGIGPYVSKFQEQLQGAAR